MSDFDETRAVCPFYRSRKGRNISCEGIGFGFETTLKFDSGARIRKHIFMYCRSITGYPSCPLYKAINQKYQEK